MKALAEQLRPLLLTPQAAIALDVHGTMDAAVLLALFVRSDSLHVVLTRRRDDLRRHPGEISFPGGRPDIEGENLLTTALREADEEIGLPRGAVEIVGALPPTPTLATNYSVYPFVGLIADGHEWIASPTEVAEILEVDLDSLRSAFERRQFTRRGITFQSDAYTVGDHVIWGATARILGDLFDRISPLLDGQLSRP